MSGLRGEDESQGVSAFFVDHPSSAHAIPLHVSKVAQWSKGSIVSYSETSRCWLNPENPSFSVFYSLSGCEHYLFITVMFY